MHLRNKAFDKLFRQFEEMDQSIPVSDESFVDIELEVEDSQELSHDMYHAILMVTDASLSHVL